MVLTALLLLFAADPLVLPLLPVDPALPDQEKSFIGPNDTEVRFTNISRPTLTVYLAAKPNGTAILVAPGGGFRHLAIDKEGHDVAKWLNTLGISAFVIKYRAGADPDRAAVENRSQDDYAAALAIVRSRAGEWKIDPRKIGLIGFSAGAKIALRAATGPAETRPAFVAPIYAGGFAGMTVPNDAPPAFFAAAQDDPLTQGNTIPAYLAWTAVKRPATVHIFPKGGHGFGIRKVGNPSDVWPDRFHEWLAFMKLTDGVESGKYSTFIDSAKVDAAFPKHTTLIDHGNYRIMAIGREKTGEAEIHADFTDVVYFVDGTATLATGGTVKSAKNTAAGEIRGAAIEGGERRDLKAGDVVTIPNGTPHHFIVKTPCRYYLVKVRTNDAGKPSTLVSFAKGGSLGSGDGYKASASHRDKDGIAEVHARDTDLMYFLRGSGTVVTGGNVVEAKTTGPEEMRGARIEAGIRQVLKPGDVIVVPNTVPHQFVDVKGSFDYFVVKVRSAQ
jgi:acetyl esterase/lipase/mannose-6-phosphate isomerase-like protein (cupin superfamily)